VTVALTCSESGSGAPVVLLHGLFGSRRNWHHIATRLSSDFRVLALDLRNHGDSPWAVEMRYIAMARDVAQHLGEKVPGGATVVGHSMGGKVAMALALAYPELVQKLVVVDISPVKYPDNLTQYIEAATRLDVCAVKRRSDADALLKDRRIISNRALCVLFFCRILCDKTDASAGA
jgi:esterase